MKLHLSARGLRNRFQTMNNNGITIWKIAGILIALYLGYHAVVWAAALILKIAIPILLVGGIVYLVYRTSGGRALTGSDRRRLP